VGIRQGSPYTALALFGFLFCSYVHSDMAMPDDASERPNILLISIAALLLQAKNIAPFL